MLDCGVFGIDRMHAVGAVCRLWCAPHAGQSCVYEGSREGMCGTWQVRVAQQAALRAVRQLPSLLADFNIARRLAEQQWQARLRSMMPA